ncbi:MAG TPA: sigma-54 dependent transcriptional regulator, partial [Polyangiaceae bacterium]|jgi:sigma-54-specific transcriptional regulator|nr:sigma-54 dependent transcriptional regulator [Polyangiaceae bacterium]
VRAKALVFEDPKSVALLARVREIAPKPHGVLISGETGTGRELVARHLHELSPRAGRPFLAVNCSGFSPDAADSELFGHAKGAWEGATSAKAGWLEAAHGGTLFLDEIGDLSPKVQHKLLRALSAGELLRVGAHEPTSVDVRVIAATNVDLGQAVLAGRFSQELLTALSAATLELAPLRERAGDILPLARHFLEFYRQRLDLGPTELGAEAAARLLEHSWPGNIRELENAMHHALLLCHGSQITTEDLRLSALDSAATSGPRSGRRSSGPGRANGSSGSNGTHDAESERTPLELALLELFEQEPPDLFEQIENVVLKTAYHYCSHNQLQTARLLGISRNVVRARLIRFGEIAGSLRGARHAQQNRAPEAREITG